MHTFSQASWKLTDFTDYRKVNSVTKTDTFTIPGMDDCIDKVEKAKYVTKLNLVKEFWQVPLRDLAKNISALVTTGIVKPALLQIVSITVKPLLSGHPRDLPKCLLNKGVRLIEVHKNYAMFGSIP